MLPICSHVSLVHLISQLQFITHGRHCRQAVRRSVGFWGHRASPNPAVARLAATGAGRTGLAAVLYCHLIPPLRLPQNEGNVSPLSDPGPAGGTCLMRPALAAPTHLMTPFGRTAVPFPKPATVIGADLGRGGRLPQCTPPATTLSQEYTHTCTTHANEPSTPNWFLKCLSEKRCLNFGSVPPS